MVFFLVWFFQIQTVELFEKSIMCENLWFLVFEYMLQFLTNDLTMDMSKTMIKT